MDAGAEVGKVVRGNDRRNVYAGVELGTYVRRHERMRFHKAMETVDKVGSEFICTRR